MLRINAAGTHIGASHDRRGDEYPLEPIGVPGSAIPHPSQAPGLRQPITLTGPRGGPLC